MNKFLSFGHFGKGAGARHKDFDESLICEAFVSALLAELKYDPEYIHKQGEKNLNEVIKTINTKANNISFAIEFHLNASGTGKAQGCEVVVSPKTSKANRTKAAELSCIISDSLHIKNRGVRTSDKTPRKTLAFVDKTNCPSMIVELCFIDNDDDMGHYLLYRSDLVRAVALFLLSI